jgi:hypothetical protein
VPDQSPLRPASPHRHLRFRWSRTTVALGVITGAGALALGLTGTAQAFGNQSAEQPTRAATIPNGQTIGHDPSLHDGQEVSFTAGGFAPGATVSASLTCPAQTVGRYHADRSGVARVSFRVPPRLQPGRYLVAVSGAGAATSSPAAGPIVATVPRFARYPFSIPAPHGQHAATISC